MTVQTAETKTHYAGNGLTTEWPIPFPVVQEEHIKLIKTSPDGEDEEITTGYTVNGMESGAVSITYPAGGEPLGAGWQLTIYRDMPLTQTLDLESGGAFDAEVIERQGFDHVVMQIQQLQEQASRALQLAITDSDRTPDEVLGEMFELRDAAQQALTSAQQALQTAQEASQTANQASQATQDAIAQIEQTLQETVQTVQDAQQALQDMDALMQEVETLAESLEGLGDLGEILQEVQTALGEVQDALTALNARGPGGATVSGFTPLAPEGWGEGWALTLAADGSTTYSAPPEIPTAAAPSIDHPEGVAGIVVPDGETITIEDGKLKGGASYLPGTIVWNSTNTIFPGFIFIDEMPGLLSRAAYPGIVGFLEQAENSAIWVEESVWQSEVAVLGRTGKYSKGDGSTTWRPPYIPETFIGASGPDRPMGTAKLDQFQGHAFQVSQSLTAPVWRYPYFAQAQVAQGSNYSAVNALSDTAGSEAAGYQRIISDNTNGVPRIGERTEPRSVYWRAMLCVSNTTVNASEQNIQELVDTLVHKLDISTYQANSTYSTPEVDTGKKWINGKTIYRKIVETGVLPNNTTKNVAHGITGITALVKLDRIAYRPSDTTYISMLYGGTTIFVLLNMTNIILSSSANASTYTSSFVMLEYTK